MHCGVGVPVITCLGSTFVGRMAASLLNACGLAELVTTSLGDYEALALQLAHNPTRLRSLREKLSRNRDDCSLFNTKRFTRNIEIAYETMWSLYQMREPPESFAVENANPLDSERGHQRGTVELA
jgi:protein O-GlcNAc transferase